MNHRARVLLVLVCLIAIAHGPRADARAQASGSDVPAALARLIDALADVGSDAEREALLDRESARLDLVLRRAVNATAVAVQRSGDETRAMALLVAARRIAERIGDRIGVGDALVNLATSHGRRGEYDDTIQLLTEAARIGRENAEPTLVSAALNNLGVAHRLRGDLDLALASYEESATIAEAAGHKPGLAGTLNNVGIILMQQGRYRESLATFERALVLKREVRAEDISTTLVNIGTIQLQQGNTDAALTYFADARQSMADTDRQNGLPNLHNLMGKAYERQARYTDAAAQYGLAQSLGDQMGQRAIVATALYNLGSLAATEGATPRALEYLDRSLSQREDIGNRAGVAETLIERGTARLRLGDLSGAAADGERALGIVTDAGIADSRLAAETLLGSVDARRGRLDDARRHFSNAIAIVESLRGQVAGGELALARYLDLHLAPYQGLLRVEIDDGRTAQALQVAERSRARVLLETLRYGRQPVAKAMTPEETTRERELRQAVTVLSARLASARSRRVPAAEIDTLSQALSAARTDAAGFEALLFARHPDLGLFRGNLPSFDDADLNDVLPPGNAAAIEFAVLPDRTIAFVAVRRVGQPAPILRSYVIPIDRQALATRAQAFRQRLAQRDLTIRAVARDVHRLLIEPAGPWLRGIESLVIVPDGPLWELPFQALEAADGRYLIESTTVSYAPSLNVLREMRRLGRARPPGRVRRTVLAIGSSGAGAAVVDSPAAGAGLPALVEAESQARAIGVVYGPADSTVIVGRDARIERLRQEASGHRIVHVAAHGVLDNSSPLDSYLVLSPDDDPESALVAAASLMDMSLDADLVVLSACETARGTVGGGEGLIGLTWALFVAGTSSTVVSQWQVGAASTTELMRDFHTRLRARMRRDGLLQGRAAALRESARAMLRRGPYAHPFYWAPFVVIGDGS